MSFQLVPKSATLNNLERGNGHLQVIWAEMAKDKTRREN